MEKVGPTLLVLSAGMGSRYGGLKQIDRMGKSGEWLLQYALFDAAKAGFQKVVFIIRRDFEDAFRNEIYKRCPDSLEVKWVYQEMSDLPVGCSITTRRSKPLGTAHAIWCGRNAIDRSFAVINADDFYGRKAFERMRCLLDQLEVLGAKDTYCMVAYRLERTLSRNGHVARGVCQLTETGELKKVTEFTRIVNTENGPVDISEEGNPVTLNYSDLVSMNLWGFTPSIFCHLEEAIRQFIETSGNDPRSEIFIPFVVDDLIGRNLARTIVANAESEWFGVTYPEDKAFVQNEIKTLIAKGIYPDPLINHN